MSKYTTTLRSICEYYAGYKEAQDDYSTVIDKSYDKIFTVPDILITSDIDLYTKKAILREYYMREIGFETTGYFKMKLNQMYIRECQKYNAIGKAVENFISKYSEYPDLLLFTNFTHTLREAKRVANGTEDKKETRSQTVDKTATEDKTVTDEKTSTEKTTSRFSDTPQGSLSNIENNTYLTNATITDQTHTDNGTQKTNGTATGKDTTAENITHDNESTTNDNTNENITNSGITLSRSVLSEINEIYKTIITIPEIVISDMNQLFLSILY